MYKTSQSKVQPQGDDSQRAWWLLHGDAGPTAAGAVGIGQLGPGVENALHRHPHGEEAILVLEGTGAMLTATAEVAAAPGTMLFAPRSSWHGVRAGDDGMLLLMVYGGVSRAADAGRQLAEGPVSDDGPSAVVTQLDDAPPQPFHDPGMGFNHMQAAWRVDADHGGAEHVVVGQTTFAPGEGAHELHAHPSGDEFQIILQGQAAHVMPDGTELPLGPGDMTLMPAGELHGVRNHGSAPLLTAFGFLGANSLERAGYEMPAEKAS
jgi:quercetin dioxygenase-like cupin family protein